MYLSKLVFLCVKNVLYYNDNSFNYNDFLAGNFDSDPDYDTAINNVFTPLNEAIARLNDLGRIPYRIDEANFVNDVADLKQFATRETDPRKVKEVISVGQFHIRRPEKLDYKCSANKVFLCERKFNGSPVFIEYKEDIPWFTREDIPQKNPLTDEAYEPEDEEYRDVDLSEKYNISDSICNYIIEYVQGKLLEPIAPDLANMHITRAEAYFSNITPVSKTFVQSFVRKLYSISD